MAEPNWQVPPPAATFEEVRAMGTYAARMKKARENDELAELLRQNPGRWALIGQRGASGGGDHFKRRGLEVTTRLRTDGQFDIFVRAPE